VPSRRQAPTGRERKEGETGEGGRDEGGRKREMERDPSRWTDGETSIEITNIRDSRFVIGISELFETLLVLENHSTSNGNGISGTKSNVICGIREWEHCSQYN
jgi:hypothetical protein